MKHLRFLFFPFAYLYGGVIALRNFLYSAGILPSKEFNIPVIGIGNLSVGGTGKSPMIEYLVRLLEAEFHLAIISRGYKRHTTGFYIATHQSTSIEVGDEPLQFKKKFPNTIVSVDENRRHGIEQLLEIYPHLKVVLMDDAFQHRRVEPSINLLLTDYNRMYYHDFLLPVGYLREWRSAKKRADLIIVTKCPDSIRPVEKRIILKKIHSGSHQQVFFAHTAYSQPVPVFPSHSHLIGYFNTNETWGTVVLLTGISSPKALKKYLETKSTNIIAITYPDHHEYGMVDVNKVVEVYNSIKESNKVIITTEKDAMRLDKKGIIEQLEKLPLFYIPIKMTFEENEKKKFDSFMIESIQRISRPHQP
jgi:tetraacyldisaccharide 4'-kinase